MTKLKDILEGTCGYGEDGELGDEPAGPHLLKKNESRNKSLGEKDLMKYLMKRFKFSKKKSIDTMKKAGFDISMLERFDLEEACYAGSPDSRYCTGIENGGTHWMFYPTVITVSFNGTIQTFSEDNTWTEIINYLDLQGAPVSNTMTLEEVNTLAPDDLTVSLTGMAPCLCD